MNVEECVGKICRIPEDFRTSDKSPYQLAKDSGFLMFSESISTRDIEHNLIKNTKLIDAWQLWSLNKRTWGYCLTTGKSPAVSAMNQNATVTFNKAFDSNSEACAEFIYREVTSILGIDKNQPF